MLLSWDEAAAVCLHSREGPGTMHEPKRKSIHDLHRESSGFPGVILPSHTAQQLLRQLITAPRCGNNYSATHSLLHTGSSAASLACYAQLGLQASHERFQPPRHSKPDDAAAQAHHIAQGDPPADLRHKCHPARSEPAAKPATAAARPLAGSHDRKASAVIAAACKARRMSPTDATASQVLSVLETPLAEDDEGGPAPAPAGAQAPPLPAPDRPTSAPTTSNQLALTSLTDQGEGSPLHLPPAGAVAGLGAGALPTAATSVKGATHHPRSKRTLRHLQHLNQRARKRQQQQQDEQQTEGAKSPAKAKRRRVAAAGAEVELGGAEKLEEKQKEEAEEGGEKCGAQVEEKEQVAARDGVLPSGKWIKDDTAVEDDDGAGGGHGDGGPNDEGGSNSAMQGCTDGPTPVLQGASGAGLARKQQEQEQQQQKQQEEHMEEDRPLVPIINVRPNRNLSGLAYVGVASLVQLGVKRSKGPSGATNAKAGSNTAQAGAETQEEAEEEQRNAERVLAPLLTSGTMDRLTLPPGAMPSSASLWMADAAAGLDAADCADRGKAELPAQVKVVSVTVPPPATAARTRVMLPALTLAAARAAAATGPQQQQMEPRLARGQERLIPASAVGCASWLTWAAEVEEDASQLSEGAGVRSSAGVDAAASAPVEAALDISEAAVTVPAQAETAAPRGPDDAVVSEMVEELPSAQEACVTPCHDASCSEGLAGDDWVLRTARLVADALTVIEGKADEDKALDENANCSLVPSSLELAPLQADLNPPCESDQHQGEHQQHQGEHQQHQDQHDFRVVAASTVAAPELVHVTCAANLSQAPQEGAEEGEVFQDGVHQESDEEGLKLLAMWGRSSTELAAAAARSGGCGGEVDTSNSPLAPELEGERMVPEDGCRGQDPGANRGRERGARQGHRRAGGTSPDGPQEGKEKGKKQRQQSQRQQPQRQQPQRQQPQRQQPQRQQPQRQQPQRQQPVRQAASRKRGAAQLSEAATAGNPVSLAGASAAATTAACSVEVGLYADVKAFQRQQRKARALNGGAGPNSTRPVPEVRGPTTCKFWRQGRCTKGADCAFAHAGQPVTRLLPCRFWPQGRCQRGDACGFSHDPQLPEPCTSLLEAGVCPDPEHCPMGHYSAEDMDSLREYFHDVATRRAAAGAAAAAAAAPASAGAAGNATALPWEPNNQQHPNTSRGAAGHVLQSATAGGPPGASDWGVTTTGAQSQSFRPMQPVLQRMVNGGDQDF